MRYVVDNDLHIHSQISFCSADPEQTTERILKYALDNGIKTLCLADHFWDETMEGASVWYEDQNYSHISKALPLPQADGVRFLFGAETEMNKYNVVGVSKERYEILDFVVIPTTHFHMRGYTIFDEEGDNAACRAKAWINRLDKVLSMDIPFKKTGLAHLTCGLIAPTREEYLETLRLLPEKEMEILFERAAQVGVGIELNASDMGYAPEEADIVLRPYKIAKEKGCKFYMGSDAHHPQGLDIAKSRFEKGVEALGLSEEDKFVI